MQALPPSVMHSPMITLTLGNNRMSKMENGSFSGLEKKQGQQSDGPMQVLPLNILTSPTIALTLNNGRLPEKVNS